jgi:hypothetical protein
MLYSGDISTIARWLVNRLSAQGYGRDQVVELATALLEELSTKLAAEAQSPPVDGSDA